MHVPRGYAVIIGIANYRSIEAGGLAFPESDADAVYRALISPQGGSFPAENVHRLLGRDATLANIRLEIEEWLPAVAQPEDRVIVYFAGHGVISHGHGYFAPWDVDVSRIEETAYPMQILGNVLANRVKARWKALFADTCHSGKINAETTDEGVAAQLDSAAGQFLSFAATLGREKSYEDPKLSTGFGLFSYFLVEALKGNADTNCDGLVTADELVEYVRFNVRDYASKRGVMQTPHAGSDYDPAMPMALSTRCGPKELAPSVSGSAVIEADSDDVEIFIDDNLIGKVAHGMPLNVPGLAMGLHVIKAAKPGYKPEVQQITIIPGQAAPVSIHMRFPVMPKRHALELDQEGDRLLHSRVSSVNTFSQFRAAPQNLGDIRRAKDFFVRALQEDPSYGVAAYNLGKADQLLDDDAGSKAAFKNAVTLDPTFTQARLEYADLLLADGDADEAIRQLTEASRFEPQNEAIYGRLAGAFWEKGIWKQCLSAADQALALNARSVEGNFRRADCLRELAVQEASSSQKALLFTEARDSYQAFLMFTNFSTSALRWIGYITYGISTRTHADRKDTYNLWRNQGYLGLCISEKNLGNLLKAREYCSRAISYEPDDAIAYFFLGNVYRDLFNQNKSCDSAREARSSYEKVVSLNPNLSEAKNARNYLDQFDGLSAALHRRGCSF